LEHSACSGEPLSDASAELGDGAEVDMGLLLLFLEYETPAVDGEGNVDFARPTRAATRSRF
jgi:hypothetical protein